MPRCKAFDCFYNQDQDKFLQVSLAKPFMKDQKTGQKWLNNLKNDTASEAGGQPFM